MSPPEHGWRPGGEWEYLLRAPLRDFPIRDEILFQFLPDPAGCRALEFGPGCGATALRVATRTKELWLVEISEAANRAQRELFADRSDVRCLAGDICAPLAARMPAGLDLVYSLDCFELVASAASCLENTARMLRRGGRALIAYPNIPPPRGHARSWFEDTEQLDAVLRPAGFSAWSLYALTLRPRAAWWLERLHDRPLAWQRRHRAAGWDPARLAAPYGATWSFGHQHAAWPARCGLNLAWAALRWSLGRAPLFDAAPIRGAIGDRSVLLLAEK